MLHHRIDHDDYACGWQRQRLILERTAIDQKCSVALSKTCDVLIHDAAAGADELVLCALTPLRERKVIERLARLSQERESRRHFEGSRGAEPSTARHTTREKHLPA